LCELTVAKVSGHEIDDDLRNPHNLFVITVPSEHETTPARVRNARAEDRQKYAMCFAE